MILTGVVPAHVVMKGITSTDNIDGRLSDGSAAFEQQMNCDPLPCTFTYELTSEYVLARS